MAEKIKCDCGITFEVEEGQTHCNYCGIKLSDISKGNEAKNKKKSQSIFTYFLWWQINKDELQKQIEEYKTLKITQSSRGISFLLILGSAILSVIFVLLQIYPNDTILVSLIIYLPLGFLIYKGKRWAMLIMMILWTLDKGFQISGILSSGEHLINMLQVLFWWSIFMNRFYLSFRVENERRKLAPILKDIPDSTFCYKCGETLELDSKFCPKCGVRVIYPPKK